MAEESTTPDLVERWRQMTEAFVRRDFDATMSFVTADVVWDMSPMGMGVEEGRDAVLGFLDDWWASYAKLEIEPEAMIDLGSGITFGVIVQSGRPVGSGGEVRLRWAQVGTWTYGKVVRLTNYPYSELDEARAAAERLAEERG